MFEMYFANSYLQKLELLWHYGVRSLMKMDSLVKSLLNNFSRVYDHLEFGHWTDTGLVIKAIFSAYFCFTDLHASCKSMISINGRVFEISITCQLVVILKRIPAT